ncbi:hypothetical protein Pmar_PMAR029456 [Perkinsus marinus ATCC 50983]|uniref:PIH1 N-terminal domain-containing protein n=1 Tax=Perkinsus marinus (strain ATCC 50983 / TXsc) TaxID=423536 RepID=C5KGQ7_PERM5|nr:hypothetical protein Pmar_PMAR029456 [Perkinsus marinus ATCC 50983]EER16325.1 hypothetical protein Pmar_PMAR029456 [Perkinsus marinus ATCC 50983]|eukprot:XP_002784529.1 hypothetical protein Pmar_PMAR029456 [Perkinsus marinus ATCC 50983]
MGCQRLRIDVVFNPEVLTKAMDTTDGGEYKRTICHLALSGVGRKYGMDSLDLDNFVTPKMRYKGEEEKEEEEEEEEVTEL